MTCLVPADATTRRLPPAPKTPPPFPWSATRRPAAPATRPTSRHSVSLLGIARRIASVKKRRKRQCGKHRHHRVRSRRNPRRPARCEPDAAQKSAPPEPPSSIPIPAARQPEHRQHRADVQQNRTQMPSPRPQSKQCVIQHRPRHEQRPVIDLMPRHVIPQVAAESAWQIAPRSDDRTVHNLRPVIPHKIERQRAAVEHESNQPKKGSSMPGRRRYLASNSDALGSDCSLVFRSCASCPESIAPLSISSY